MAGAGTAVVGATVVTTGGVVEVVEAVSTDDVCAASAGDTASTAVPVMAEVDVAGEAETGYRTGRTDGSATRAANTTTTPMTPSVTMAFSILRITGYSLASRGLNSAAPGVACDTRHDPRRTGVG